MRQRDSRLGWMGPLMNLRDLTFPIYGTPLPGKQPSEAMEMTSFFNRLRKEYPDSWGRLALHIRNEDARASARHVLKMKAEGGFVTGAPDVFIPGCPAFIMEMKSRSKAARLSKEQIEYLTAAQQAGAFACVALGAEAAWLAFAVYLERHYAND